MSAPKLGDLVLASPVHRKDLGPRIRGQVAGVGDTDGHRVILVRSETDLVTCDELTASVLEAAPDPVVDTRPDLVIAVYGDGRAEARRRRSDVVLAQDVTLAALVLRLVSTFPDGLHLDIRYDPHM